MKRTPRPMFAAYEFKDVTTNNNFFYLSRNP